MHLLTIHEEDVAIVRVSVAHWREWGLQRCEQRVSAE